MSYKFVNIYSTLQQIFYLKKKKLIKGNYDKLMNFQQTKKKKIIIILEKLLFIYMNKENLCFLYNILYIYNNFYQRYVIALIKKLKIVIFIQI